MAGIAPKTPWRQPRQKTVAVQSGSSPQTAIDLTDDGNTGSAKRKRGPESENPRSPPVARSTRAQMTDSALLARSENPRRGPQTTRSRVAYPMSSLSAAGQGQAQAQAGAHANYGQALSSRPPPPSATNVKNAQGSGHVAATTTTPATAPQEKRARRFREQAPQSFGDVYLRATTQRFYVLQRTRGGSDECPEEEVELTGSTGSIYTVNIGLKPGCTCPQAKKGLQCKHVVFVMSKVLRAPHHLVYQLALVSSELRDLFASAPPVEDPAAAGDDRAGGDANNKRKPIEGDCPICYSELKPEPESSGDAPAGRIVWCRAACGQNMHRGCFEMWARTKKGNVTCPMCRSVWEGAQDVVGSVDRSRGTLVEGYVNVADQLGISTARDTSTYSQWYGSTGRGRGRGGGSRFRWY